MRKHESWSMSTKKRKQCSECGGEARMVRGDYEFKESGLRDVVLLDIELVKCGECGNVDPVLFRLEELMHLVAVAVLQKQYRLEGEELRFLRKHSELTQEEFAKLLHVDKTTLSKWENDRTASGFRAISWLGRW